MTLEMLGNFGAPELFLMAAVVLLLWAAKWSPKATEPESSTPNAGPRVADRAYLDRLFGVASTTSEAGAGRGGRGREDHARGVADDPRLDPAAGQGGSGRAAAGERPAA